MNKRIPGTHMGRNVEFVLHPRNAGGAGGAGWYAYPIDGGPPYAVSITEVMQGVGEAQFSELAGEANAASSSLFSEFKARAAAIAQATATIDELDGLRSLLDDLVSTFIANPEVVQNNRPPGPAPTDTARGEYRLDGDSTQVDMKVEGEVE